MVTFSYKPKKGQQRSLDFYVVAADEDRATELVGIAIARGRDANGYNLKWARNVPWKRGKVHAFKTKTTEIAERVEVH